MKDGLVALTNFKLALPKIELSQAQSLERLVQLHTVHAVADRKNIVAPLVKRYGVKPPKISTRRFESIDIGENNATIEDRARFFLARAKEIFSEFYPLNATPPSHIVHVTCTGYVSPSAAQEYVASLNEKCAVTHAYHMGCYAALPAIRIAEGLVTAEKARGETNYVADIVHNEMCALHMNTSNSSPEQLVVQSLFADGHMKYSVVNSAEAKRGFEVIAIREAIVPDSVDDMTWIPSDGGMRMTLSRDVPTKIASVLRPFLTSLCEQAGASLAELLKTATFAVHPGGPKIIEAVQEILELRDDQVQASHHVLKTRGNMSSATLPHVWDTILNEEAKDRHPVVSLAFGPGLTIFGSVFKVIGRP